MGTDHEIERRSLRMVPNYLFEKREADAAVGTTFSMRPGGGAHDYHCYFPEPDLLPPCIKA